MKYKIDDDTKHSGKMLNRDWHLGYVQALRKREGPTMPILKLLTTRDLPR